MLTELALTIHMTDLSLPQALHNRVALFHLVTPKDEICASTLSFKHRQGRPFCQNPLITTFKNRFRRILPFDPNDIHIQEGCQFIFLNLSTTERKSL